MHLVSSRMCERAIIVRMSDQDEGNESFEETMREIAREVSRSVERAMEQVNVDEIAGVIGIDPARAKEWVDNAGGWLRGQVESFGEDASSWSAKHEEVLRSAKRAEASWSTKRETAAAKEDPLRHAGPHPLDLPTDEQGLALAALDSGRWTVEPGSQRLAAQGDGPAPSDTLGLVRELRSRDWIAADGAVTVVGHHALKRWLDAAAPH